MEEKNLQNISAAQFYKLVNKDSILETHRNITSQNLSLKPSTKYSVIIEEKPYPPKDFLRVMAQLKGFEINEDSFNGGQANKPFVDLGYEIINNKDYPFYNSSLVKSQIKKYQNAIDNTDWLNVREIYKFNFIKWLEENIDFITDTDDEIKSKIEQSQQIAYSPDSNNKGVNFIQTITRYQDDYVTLEDIQKLRKIINNLLPENKENLTLSFGSFPKTSAFLSFFEPKEYIAYDAESLPAYEFLSKEIRNSAPPKKDYKAFQFYQIFYKKIKNQLRQSNLDVTTFKNILGLETLSELQWNFIAQDFLLYITREVMNKEIKTLDITGHKLYKISMGNFLKNKEFDHINPIEQFEKNNLIVMHQFTADNQGSDFKNKLRIGDFIYLTYGQQRLSFIAQVLNEASPVNQVVDTDLDDDWICRNVEIIHNPIINNTTDLKDKSGWLPSGYTTFKEIKDIDTANQVLFNKYYNVEIIDSNKEITHQVRDTTLTNYPLNQILYGPPGTGKTYKTKELAVKIIDGYVPDSREKLTERYFELMDLGKIHFTTFHQSMSYEDFIEGIKPKMTDDNNGEIEYEIKAGLFKHICELASFKEISNFNDAYESLILDISESEEEYLVLKTPRNKEFRVNVNSNDNLSLYTSAEIKKQGVLSKEKLESHYQGERVFKGWEGYALGVLEYLEKNYNLSKEEKRPNQKHILIIDEINRGNVSAIFGELITLIENDKRIGKKEEIQLTLPYSKEKFGVPDNVYIIGTMNTADRSVEALDTALRRRFNFTEVKSSPQLLESHRIIYDILWEYKNVKWADNEWVKVENGLKELYNFNDKWDTEKIELWEKLYNEGYNPANSSELIPYYTEIINFKTLLETINERIEILIDKDHQIGHSYFFKVRSFKDLVSVFENNIIPLLEEYFYGDFAKIGLVLGKAFLEVAQKESKVKLADFEHDDKEFFNDKKLYCFTEPDGWEARSFQSIYDGKLKLGE